MKNEGQSGSPKVIASLPANTPVISAPPVVTIAPTHAHPMLSDVRKSSECLPGPTEAERVEDMVRGFQPYRAPDLPPATVASTQAQLRPTLPLDLPPSYPPYHPSLYPHHLTHQYR